MPKPALCEKPNVQIGEMRPQGNISPTRTLYICTWMNRGLVSIRRHNSRRVSLACPSLHLCGTQGTSNNWRSCKQLEAFIEEDPWQESRPSSVICHPAATRPLCPPLCQIFPTLPPSAPHRPVLSAIRRHRHRHLSTAHSRRPRRPPAPPTALMLSLTCRFTLLNE